jgi:dTDP-4-amino-4,6-dideoxygalactose transaminase
MLMCFYLKVCCISLIRDPDSYLIYLSGDCSHAHGASVNGKIVGTFGDGAAWSIQGDKVISGGEGGVTLTINPEFYYRQLIFGHYNKRCKAEIPPTHPLAAYSLTGAGLKNRAHPLAIAVALNQLRLLPTIKHFKSKHAAILIESLRSVDFLHGPDILPTAQPGWYALVANFIPSAAPFGLSRERFVTELAARGLADVDIPNSIRPLYAEPLYLRPWEILPHNYDPKTYQPRWTPTDFPCADEFHRTAIKFPVWACEDDLDVVQSYATIIKEVAKDFMSGKVSPICQ